MLRVLETATSIVERVSRAVNARSTLGVKRSERLVNAHTPEKWLPRSVSSVVDLGALELVGIIDVDGLPFGEEINGGDGGFAVAIAGLLRADKGQMRLRPNRGGVDVDDSGVQIACGLESAVHVSRVNRSGKAVRHAVRHFN